MQPIKPAEVRYIKLGPGNAWFRHCRETGRIALGHAAVPHELAQAGDWEAVSRHLVEVCGRAANKASDFTREIRDFYTLGADCLWITFAEGRLWWAFAALGVDWQGGDGAETGVRYRTLRQNWSDKDIEGNTLDASRLSTKLTCLMAYQQTLCSVAAADYAVRRINGEVEPVVVEAQVLQEQMTAIAVKMIAALHWRDFELLVDLIFGRNGWRRISAIGGTQKDIDLAVEQPITGERAIVQVKSRATAAVLRDSIARFREYPQYERWFFVCHTAPCTLIAPEGENIDLWTGGRLAEMALKAGLFDWLVERSG